MSKWIFILKLMGTNIETGEVELYTYIYQPGLDVETCVEIVVDTYIELTAAHVNHKVYCKEMPKEENEDK